MGFSGRLTGDGSSWGEVLDTGITSD